MKKIINPCKCEVYHPNGEKFPANAYVKIEYKDGRLSLSGVIGPKSNGDCYGACFQCNEEISQGKPTADWTQEMLEKLCDIWDKWHLNDTRPYCQHQKELGWREQAKEEIILYHYCLTNEALSKQKEAERIALAALKNGACFAPNSEQMFYANLSYSLDIYEKIDEKLALYYQPKKPLFVGDHGFTETKTRGWVRYDESDKGILCKPCPVCGYKYGTSWIKEEVPQEIIDWLFALPTTKTQPAWV